ncbi:MAG: hypothetical protein Q9207_007718 [Kuettlingeria erythrocarpa]
MISYATVKALPAPYYTTRAPRVDWTDEDAVREYLQASWSSKLCTLHGATAYGVDAGPYKFASYHWLYKAYHALGMPHCRSQQAFQDTYIAGYLDGAAKIEDYWEIYMEHLNDRYEHEQRRKKLGAGERAAVEDWRELMDAIEAQEEEKDDWEVEEEQRERGNERISTEQQWNEDQEEWEEDAEEGLVDGDLSDTESDVEVDSDEKLDGDEPSGDDEPLDDEEKPFQGLGAKRHASNEMSRPPKKRHTSEAA